ncbi:MAG TPA: hypothetical protein ENI27_09325 [bacterium]|nr:hypothetical protein [bacterium]
MTVLWSSLSAMFVLFFWGMSSFLNQNEIRFSLGQWVLFTLMLLWSLLGIAFVWTSMGEGEFRAAGLGVLIFGGVTVLSAGFLVKFWILPYLLV